MNINYRAICLMLVCSALLACGSGTDERGATSDEAGIRSNKDINSSEEKAEEIVKGITSALSQFGEKVETIAARDLKELLPTEVPDMTRTGYSASKKGVEGFSFSTASATFEQDAGPGVLNLSLTDIGNVRGIAKFGLEMLDIEIDEENQDGFQRTGEYKGYKSFQSSTKTRAGSESEMIVFIGDRLVLNANGQNVEWDVIEDMIDSISLKKAESLIK